MSNIHLPTMTSQRGQPFATPATSMSPFRQLPSSNSSRRTGPYSPLKSSDNQHPKHAWPRRSVPSISPSRDDRHGAKIWPTGKRSRHSLSEVVARMRFRERTLLEMDESTSEKGEPVAGAYTSMTDTPSSVSIREDETRDWGRHQSRRDFQSFSNMSVHDKDHPRREQNQGKLSGVRASSETSARDRETELTGQDHERLTHPRAVSERPPNSHGDCPADDRLPPLRKNGLVVLRNAGPVHSEPPRELALEIRGHPTLSRSVAWKQVSADVSQSDPWTHASHRQGEDGDGVAQEEERMEEGEGAEDEEGAMNDDDDDDFDFDDSEDEAEARRQEERRSQTTVAVYQRACHRLRVQPSPAFLRQSNVSTVNLSDIRLGPADVKPIAIALVRDAKIFFLDLSNNDLGPIGISYIAEMLQENTTLFDLNLSGTNPGREGVRALSETLRHNRSLAFLRLQDNSIEHTESHLLADLIKSVPSLKGLYLGHNKLGYHGGVAIASAVAQNNTLQTLDLQWNHIRRDSGVALARALARNSSLRQLNLAWNGLGKEGCLALAHALPKNTSLRELDLTCNRVDLMSLGFLLKGVTRNTSLKALKIGQNPLTTEGAKALVNAISSSPDVGITEIDIAGVPVDQEFTHMVSAARSDRMLHVHHEEAVTLATSDRKREHDGTNLDRYDPVMVLFEYMKLDNLRVIDMFQYMDVKKRDKLSKGDIRDGLNALRIPVTEHAIDVIVQKLDLNKDGFVELDEMMKVQRDTARQVKQRQIRAKAKNREDGGLSGLHKILRQVISKRTEENESRRETNILAKSTARRDSLAPPLPSTTGGRRDSLVPPLPSTTGGRRDSLAPPLPSTTGGRRDSLVPPLPSTTGGRRDSLAPPLPSTTGGRRDSLAPGKTTRGRRHSVVPAVLSTTEGREDRVTKPSRGRRDSVGQANNTTAATGDRRDNLDPVVTRRDRRDNLDPVVTRRDRRDNLDPVVSRRDRGDSLVPASGDGKEIPVPSLTPGDRRDSLAPTASITTPGRGDGGLGNAGQGSIAPSTDSSSTAVLGRDSAAPHTITSVKDGQRADRLTTADTTAGERMDSGESSSTTTTTTTTGGGRASVAGLQLTQARFSLTSTTQVTADGRTDHGQHVLVSVPDQ